MRFNNYGDVNNPPKFLAAASWDGSCKVWEIAGKLTGYGMSQRLQVETKYCGEQKPDGGPILGLDWRNDSSCIYLGTSSQFVKRWDIQSGKVEDIGKHDSPVKDVFYINDLG